MKPSVSMTILAATLSLGFTLSLSARQIQSRDHLTPQETELVKDAQILDQRIEVFIKAADRRLLALNGVTVAAKQSKKDAEKWGEQPTGTRAEMIHDIAKILDEAITNIDDVSSRDERNPLVPKALRKLATEATRIVDELKPLQSQAKSEAELGTFEQLMESAESIIQAAHELPPPTEKDGKGKSDKPKN